MEPQPPFDPERALHDWREELIAQPGVSADNVRELQSHLLQCFDQFKQRGFGDAEAFSQARRQVGSAEEVGAEFARANPARIWRERIFWMAFGSFLLWVWTGLMLPLASFTRLPWPIISAIAYLPPLLLSIGIATGKVRPRFSKSASCFGSRAAFAIGLVVVMICICALYGVAFHWSLVPAGTVPFVQVMATILAQTPWPIALAGLAIWLFPGRASFTVDNAGTSAVPASARVWRERIFWIIAAHLAISLWWNVGNAATWVWWAVYPGSGDNLFTSHYFSLAIGVIPLLLVAVRLARTGPGRLSSRFHFHSRGQAAAMFMLWCVAIVAANAFVHYLWQLRMHSPSNVSFNGWLTALINSLAPATAAAVAT